MTVWIRCAKSTAARRRSIRNKESVISAQRQHAAAQNDEKTEVHAHCQRLRLTAGMCLGFCVKRKASAKMEASAYAFGECSMIALTAVAVSVSGNSS